MSLDAITWAYRTKVKPSSIKFLLISLANYSNIDSEVWPSVDRLCELTSQDRKTVISGIKELERRGYIVDTGKRKGATLQIKVYNLYNPEDGNRFIETMPKTVLLNSTENGQETVPKTDGNSTENGFSPTPPYNDILKDTKKGYTRRSKKICLADWESINGELNCQMLKNWILNNKYDPGKIDGLIERFKISCRSGGNLYADFRAAFQKWLNEGYFKVDPISLQVSETGDPKFQIFDRGNQL